MRGRKKGLSVTLGIQSLKGVRAIYGNNEADALLGQPQTQLVLRTPEEGTAKWLEGQLGSAEIVRAGESQQVGVDSKLHGGVNRPSAVGDTRWPRGSFHVTGGYR
ncbi:MAG: type IV secretion system DNA-binding domain-containing protein [Deltaproteobacteria bacterium]|nr:type IV secretion system DNA-binding domain-containing protein [Deltaproteobacteria bacterium]